MKSLHQNNNKKSIIYTIQNSLYIYIYHIIHSKYNLENCGDIIKALFNVFYNLFILNVHIQTHVYSMFI